MKKVYPCPHCQTQNFANPERLRCAEKTPMVCWKCGREIQTSWAQKCLGSGRKGNKKKGGNGEKAEGRKTKK
ncbi:MAG: hypothetical protein NTY64_20450 [Deltaproteobacteria bacterium]|nr:hypothetical protein [Deltaproteobacteria bacterium]